MRAFGVYYSSLSPLFAAATLLCRTRSLLRRLYLDSIIQCIKRVFESINTAPSRGVRELTRTRVIRVRNVYHIRINTCETSVSRCDHSSRMDTCITSVSRVYHGSVKWYMYHSVSELCISARYTVPLYQCGCASVCIKDILSMIHVLKLFTAHPCTPL